MNRDDTYVQAHVQLLQRMRNDGKTSLSPSHIKFCPEAPLLCPIFEHKYNGIQGHNHNHNHNHDHDHDAKVSDLACMKRGRMLNFPMPEDNSCLFHSLAFLTNEMKYKLINAAPQAQDSKGAGAGIAFELSNTDDEYTDDKGSSVKRKRVMVRGCALIRMCQYIYTCTFPDCIWWVNIIRT